MSSNLLGAELPKAAAEPCFLSPVQLPPCAAPLFFAFDLDGTLTLEEILPHLAQIHGQKERMAQLTLAALNGHVPYATSLAERVACLADLPLPQVHAALRSLPLDPALLAFIHQHPRHCAVLTSNIDLWLQPLAPLLQCPIYASTAQWLPKPPPGHLHVTHWADKAALVRQIQAQGFRVVAIGDSCADIPMLQAAHIAVAHCAIRPLPPALTALAQHTSTNSATLCAWLEEIGAAAPNPAWGK